MVISTISLLISVLVFILPFLYFPVIVDPFEFPKATFFIFAIIFTISLYEFGILTQGVKKVKISTIHYLLMTYLAVQIIGSIFGADFFRSFWGQYFRYQGIITQLCFFAFFFLVSQGKTLLISPKKLLENISLAGTVTAVLVLLQALAFYVLKLPVYTFNGRMTAFLGNPNFAAGFLALSFIAALYTLSHRKALKIAAAALFFLAIILTQSRAAFLLFLAAVFWEFFKRKKAVVRAGLIAAAVLVLLVFYPQRPISSFEDRSLILQKAGTAFLKRPVFGWGVENFELAFKDSLKNEGADLDLKNIRVDKAHNELAEIAVASGIAGLASYLVLIGYSLKKLWRKRKDPLAQTSLLLLLGFLFLAQFNVLNITQYLIFYIVLANVHLLSEK